MIISHCSSTADYRKWQLPEKKLYHDPNSYQAPEAPFEGLPTYKTDYRLHPFSMRQSLRPDEGNRGPTDPFDGRTGYRDDYIKHPLEQKLPKEKACYKGPSAPIDGKSIDESCLLMIPLPSIAYQPYT